MAIAMVAMLAFGGTYAYFTATANSLAAKEVQTGVIELTDATVFGTVKDNVLPMENMFTSAQTISFSSGNSTRAQVAFITVKVELFGKDSAALPLPAGADASITFTTTSVKDTDFVAVTEDTWEEGESSIQMIYAVLVPVGQNAALNGVNIAFDATADNLNGAGHALMGATLKLTVSARSVQAQINATTEVTTIDALKTNMAALKDAVGIA